MDALAPIVLPLLRQQQAPLRGKIIGALRNAIETGKLEAGQRLIERDLCEQLGVSRTALREALRELQADGVIGHSSTGRLIVAPLPADEAANAYRIRAALEALVVAQFIEAADADRFREVARRGKTLLAAYRSGDVEDMLVSKRAFYDAICLGAGNPLAFEIINRLVLRTSSLRRRSMARSERQAQSIREIEVLLAAIDRRDMHAAGLAAATHVHQSARSALG